jgi:hypothetical protein
LPKNLGILVIGGVLKVKEDTYPTKKSVFIILITHTMQQYSINMISLLKKIKVGPREIVVMSIGSACHRGHLGHCTDQFLSQHTYHKTIDVIDQEENIRKTLIIIDSNFDEVNLRILEEHLLGLLGYRCDSIQSEEKVGIQTHLLNFEKHKLNVYILVSDLPIDFQNSNYGNNPPPFTVAQQTEYNQGIKGETFDLFYRELQSIGEEIESNLGVFMLFNFVRFKQPNSKELYICRWLQAALYKLFPHQELLSEGGGLEGKPIRRIFLCWTGYILPKLGFGSYLYEPVYPTDPGISMSVTIESRHPKVFVPYRKGLQGKTIIDMMPRGVLAIKKLFQRGIYIFIDVSLISDEDGGYKIVSFPQIRE